MIQKHSVSTFLGLSLLVLAIAAALYPGGSQANLQSNGYDLANNYLCNLFDC